MVTVNAPFLVAKTFSTICCSLPILVNNRKLRFVVRAVQDPDGNVGDLRGAAPYVGRPPHSQT